MRAMRWLTGKGGRDVHTGDAAITDVRSPAEGGYRPVQTGAALLESGERRRLLRSLTENSPFSAAVTRAWWLDPLQEMAARVQECPAAWQGAFSGPGGFTDLSLNVAVRAVRLVRGMMLPPGATPEEQAEQAAGWTCAACWAGLFHHLSWLINTEGALKNGAAWYPGFSVPAGGWRVRPVASGTHSAAPENGVYLASQLLPAAGVLWLRRWPGIYGALISFLAGQQEGGALLHAIISEARISCDFAPADVSLPAAPVAGLASAGKGAIAPVVSDTSEPLLSSLSAPLPPENPIDTPLPAYTQSPQTSRPGDVLPSQPVLAMPGLASALSAGEDVKPAADSSEVGEGDSDTAAGAASVLTMLDLMTKGQPAAATTAPVSTPEMPSEPELQPAESSATGDGDSGERFVSWLKGAVADGTLPVNECESVLHVLAQFVFLVSPVCFYRYLSACDSETADKDRLQKDFEALGLHYSRNGKGLFHYHKYESPDKSGRYTKLSGYMIKTDIIFDKGSCPADSVWLSAKK